MSKVVHGISLVRGTILAREDVLTLGIIDVPTVVGGSAGAAVVTPVVANLAPSYAVFVESGQDSVAFVTAKTAAGFTLTLRPRLATDTLAAGTTRVLILA